MNKFIFVAILMAASTTLLAETAATKGFVDIQRELDIKKWKEDQNNLPDNQRLLVASFGESVLIEKATGLTLGVYPVENGKVVKVIPKAKMKHIRTRQLQISFNSTMYAYEIGGADACPDSNDEIIANNKNYIFWIDRCFGKNRRGEAANAFAHYIFDKKQKKVVMLLSSLNPMEGPTIKFQNGVYKYRWIGRNENEEKVNYYYEFEIKPKDGADLTCHKTWNDNCGDLNLVPLLYKK